MRIVNFQDAEINFSKLIDAVGRGEEIVIDEESKHFIKEELP